MASDKTKCDLLIVIGSSLKVRPVALIPSSLPAHVPQILINREQLHHLEFDVQLLGDSDVIINQLCHRLAEDFTDICYDEKVLQESNCLQSCEGLLPLSRDSTTSEVSHNSDISTNNDETATTEDDDDNDEDTNNVKAGVVEKEEGEINNAIEELERTVAEECFDVPQQLDTDSQSVKSNASTDIALRSDSGFESSTSSGNNTNLASADSQNSNNDEEISITAAAIVVDEMKMVEILAQRDKLAAKSNITTVTSTIPKPILEKSVVVVNNIKSSMQSCHKTVVKKHHKQKRRNTAECLLDGTYFCNEKKSAYVFPGAQVSWYTSSSSEEDEDDDDDADEVNDKRKDSLDDRETKIARNSSSLTTLSTLSMSPPTTSSQNNNKKSTTTTQMTMHNKQMPLETLSAALAKATIPTPNTPPPTATAEKRRSDSEDNEHDDYIAETILHDDHVHNCIPPPVKKRRDSNAEELYNNKVVVEEEEEEEGKKLRNISLNCNSRIPLLDDN